MHQQKLANALNPAYKKVSVDKAEYEAFEQSLKKYLQALETPETEEHYKTPLQDLLNEVGYRDSYAINTKGRADFVIFNESSDQSSAGVLFETKAPNSTDMVTLKSLDKKSMQELILYYLRERVDQENNALKHLVITDFYAWFVFDAVDFYNLVFKNAFLKKKYKEWNSKQTDSPNTESFYKDIASPFIKEIQHELPFTYFAIDSYANAKERQKVNLLKFLSPDHFLKKFSGDDSNKLNRTFYHELLHIIGLEEEGKSKKLINRRPEGERNEGSLIENAIHIIERDVNLGRIDNLYEFGAANEEQRYNIALELSITWVNRILFLKLLEAQLLSYHGGDESYRFLNSRRIGDWDELNKLFFDVLAIPQSKRHSNVRGAYDKVPYLNSSLFERTDLEEQAILISQLDNMTLPLRHGSVIKKKEQPPNTLHYLFQFLEAYDFSSEAKEQVIHEKKTLINASVLGLIFEKINGYKDGSFFTPGFITMYMCRETLQRAVVQKFNDAKGWSCQTLDDIYDKIEDRQEANDLINTIRIIDPAVGSGHFLVSALNELIFIKHELKILQDRKGRRLKEYRISIQNDELHIQDDDGDPFEYKVGNEESQRVQETLFHEKQTLIENCLFGVDINPNSVKICRLRLWIELLKNAYYLEEPLLTTQEGKADLQLETLPNIDINIKVGNSLISRFGLDEDLGEVFRKQQFSIQTYRDAVAAYKDTNDKEAKAELQAFIKKIKEQFRSSVLNRDPLVGKIAKTRGQLMLLENNIDLFAEPLDTKKKDLEIARLKKLLAKQEQEREDQLSDILYQNAFEWRFEFPEVLDENGDYMGFDVCIGNPPYIRQEELGDFKKYLQNQYKTYAGTADILVYFLELGMKLLKDKGHFSNIIANKFMRANFGKALRKWLVQFQIDEIIDFGDLPVFQEATTYPCIYSSSKKVPDSSFRSATVSTLEFALLETHLQSIRKTTDQNMLNPEGWGLVSQEVQNLLVKIKEQGVPLEKYVEGKVYRGVLTGLNEAFVIGEATKNKLVEEDPKSDEIIKPFLAGKDIKRYQTPRPVKYLIFSRRGIEIEKYPAILNYLKKYKSKLEPKPVGYKGEWKGRKPGSYKWYELQDAIDYHQEFKKGKIVYPNILKQPEFAFDDQATYTNQKCFIISVSDFHLLGILNSSLNHFLFEQILPKLRGNFYEPSYIFFKNFPIAKKTDNKIETFVTQILTLKKENPEADTSKLEKEIDQLVYELYGLTQEEINTNQKCFIISVSDFHLLGILNSSLNHFLFEQILPKLRGNFYEPSYIFFKNFPIAKKTDNKIETFVTQILTLKKENPEADTSELEKEIDQLVYELYGLTREEITLIEQSVR